MTVSPLPTSAKSLAAAEAFVEEKRVQLSSRAAAREELLQGLAEGFAELDLGISKVSVGSTVVDLRDEDPLIKSAALEDHWSTLIAQGKSVGMICAGNLAWSYHGKEKVAMEERALEELIDAELVRALAPSAVIYSASEVTPWPGLFPNRGYQIWVESKEDLAALWNESPRWTKTAWHDEVMKKDKHPRLAVEMFSTEAYHDLAPDLTFRLAQHARAERLVEQSAAVGDWDAQAQAELKKALGALIGAAGHPIFGAQIESAIAGLTPLLARSMEGKERHKKVVAAAQKTEEHLMEGFHRSIQEWNSFIPAPFLEEPRILKRPRQ